MGPEVPRPDGTAPGFVDDVHGCTNVASAGCAGATQLKTPYRDGTTHVILLRAACPPLFKIAPGDLVEPLDFSARPAALVPKPRVNLDALPRGFLRRTANIASRRGAEN
jgi:hypothetical protein